MKTRFLLPLAILAFATDSFSQKQFWKQAPQQVAVSTSSDWNKVSGLQVFNLDHNAFRNFLIQQVPAESANAKPVAVSLPMPDGNMRTFYITESTVMEEGLSRQFPDIKSYKGTDGVNYMRMCISPFGFQACILTGEGDIIIEAIDKKNLNQYGVFHSKDLVLDSPINLSCGTHEFSEVKQPENKNADGQIQPRTGAGILGMPVSLRTYRLAVTCTGEWGESASLGGGSVASAIAKMNAALVYINAVYEKDFAIHMNLIASNNQLIWLDGASDPFPFPTGGGQILGINTQIINAKVGPAAYDIGHNFTIGCTDVGGIASLGCVCQDNKGNGVTCWYTSDIAYVSQRITCHEMGHQFVASHTFSNCNGNEAGTSYEPGSGTTIMSYSGLCGADLNVETGNLPHPNYFHSNSLERVISFSRTGDGSRCGQTTFPGNSYPDPEILFPSGLYIPIRTPFVLRGRATDMENDSMTYNWEQYDAGGYGPILGEPSLTEEGPLFKSVFPGVNPNRVVPVWNTILTKGNYERTEVLPTVDREINFRFNVRDNHPGAGGAEWEQVFFRSLASAGPFAVTNPNVTQTDTMFVGLCNKISWDVANTANSLVNCKKVNIYLMPVRTNPNVLIPLVLNTDNDGEELVDIPDTLAGRNLTRIVVEAADNIFFDASDTDIRIRTASYPKLVFGVAPNALQFCVPDKATIDIRSCANNVTGNVELFVESGLPDNARYSFDNSSINANDQTKLQLDFTDVKISGIYTLVIAAVTPFGDTLREEITLDLVSVDYSDLHTVYPANGLSGLSQSIEFKWTPSVNAISYTIEIATSPAFGNTIIYSMSGIKGSSFKPNILLDENKLYYWRIKPFNRCGVGGPTGPSPFSTVNKSCAEIIYPGNVLTRRANQTGSMLTPIREAGIISDVNIKNFSGYAFPLSSVTLTVISPLGTRVKLFGGNCGNTSDFKCGFDDDGSYTLVNPSNGCPPINNKLIKPLESFSKFNGEDKKGDWRLEVACDQLLSGTAQFDSYTLDICSELIVNNPILINNNILYMSRGETKSIGQDLLLSQDVDNTASELIYTVVVIPQRGDLLINGIVANYGSKFSQKDIDDGKLSYQHKGLDMEEDAFVFIVEDGDGGWFGTENFRIIIGPVGTDDEREELEVNIYPNPTSGILQISTDRTLDKQADLRIVNLQGQLMLRKNIGQQKAEILNVGHLTDGVYLLEIRSGKYYSVNKIILRK